LDFIEVKDKKAGAFSGGMKRRLNLACGISHEPELVIMDEPTVGIDPQSRNRILENVKKLNESGTTILYTTHYMPEAEEICNRLTVVDHGKVITSGTKQKIVSALGKNAIMTIKFKGSAGNLDGFISEIKACEGVADISAENNSVKIKYSEECMEMDEIIGASIKNGMTIESISTEEPALEEIFLLLTGKELRDKA
jgi:ABC-2 type transport system ATP-binding protein